MQRNHLARANAPSPLDLEHVGDSKRAGLPARSASAPGVRQLIELCIFKLSQLRRRWNGNHGL